MNTGNILRRARAAMKNAVMWGIAWGALGFVTLLTLRTIGVYVPAYVTVLDALGMSIKFGVMGGITGAAFSVFISLFYRGQRLSEISWARFAVGGGIVAGIFVPAFLVIANVLTGSEVPPLDAIRSDIVFAALFGGIAAGASMWLAQRAEVRASGRDDEPELLEGGAAGASGVRRRDRSSVGRNG
jgi:hypothetical protein